MAYQATTLCQIPYIHVLFSIGFLNIPRGDPPKAV